MAARNTPLDDRSHRVAIVEEHVRQENEHNLEGVIQSIGNSRSRARLERGVLAGPVGVVCLEEAK
jgi:hypothetical protein